MNEPRNKNNFLIEVTPKVMDELNRLYLHSEDEPVAELHYSPYWPRKDKGNESVKDSEA